MELHNDLSKHHQMVSDLFPWPDSHDEWEQYKLSDEQLEFYRENGYVAGIKLFDDHQVSVLKKELVEIIDKKHPKHELFYEYHSNESNDPENEVFHSLGHWRFTPGFHDALWNPAFVMAAYQLLGNQPVRFWHDQLFLKPARHGGVVSWHQDYSFWTRTRPMQHLTTWIGLDDATNENGCLQYVPGSHKWGLLEKPVLVGEMDALLTFMEDWQKEEMKKHIPIEMKKGYATFHHPLLIHGSFPNRSDRPRRAMVINTFVDGTISDFDGQLLAGTPEMKKEQKLEGQFFPLLFKGNGK